MGAGPYKNIRSMVCDLELRLGSALYR